MAERIGLNEWYFVIRHAMFCALALPVMIFTSMLSHRQARLVALVTFAVSLLMLWATLRFGTEVKGARRWISLAGQSVQPSEFIKPAFAVLAAWLFSESMIHRNVPGRILATLMMGSIVGALLLQPDIGQTALVTATWAVLLFLSGISWFVIFGLGAGAAGLLFGAYMFFPHVSRRIDTFLNPKAAAIPTRSTAPCSRCSRAAGSAGGRASPSPRSSFPTPMPTMSFPPPPANTASSSAWASCCSSPSS